MNKELSKDEKSLLEISVKDLIKRLTENSRIAYVKQSAFDYWSKESIEQFQIQVTVTREESDFLDPFQTEECTTLNKLNHV